MGRQALMQMLSKTAIWAFPALTAGRPRCLPHWADYGEAPGSKNSRRTATTSSVAMREPVHFLPREPPCGQRHRSRKEWIMPFLDRSNAPKAKADGSSMVGTGSSTRLILPLSVRSRILFLLQRFPAAAGRPLLPMRSTLPRAITRSCGISTADT